MGRLRSTPSEAREDTCATKTRSNEYQAQPTLRANNATGRIGAEIWVGAARLAERDHPTTRMGRSELRGDAVPAAPGAAGRGLGGRDRHVAHKSALVDLR